MTLITAGSGLGGFTAIVNQPTYGATFVTPTRTLYFKSNRTIHDPHIVQGGPYLAGGRIVDIGSAHVTTWQDAKGTLTGDVMSTGMALLLAASFGSNGKLVQSGTTTAYELGGSGGIKLEAAESHDAKAESGFAFDMQIGIPYTNAEVQAYNYHSCIINKAEFVFERAGLVSYTFDWDAQYVETTTALITPTFTTSGVPFSMGNTSSAFEIGNPGSMSALPGVRKMTVTLEKKFALDRIYLGQEHKSAPVSNGLVDIKVAAEVDYTSQAKTIYQAFLANEALELVAKAVGAAIGSSGKSNTLQFALSNAFINSGGEPPLDGPDLVKNTVNLLATINAANEPALTAKLISADSTF